MMKNGVNNGRKKLPIEYLEHKNCDWHKSAFSMGRWCVSLTNLLMQSYNISLRAQKFCMFFATHFKHISKASQRHPKDILYTFKTHQEDIPKREAHDDRLPSIAHRHLIGQELRLHPTIMIYILSSFYI